ncbi:MAG: hypothetical protein ACOCWQ_01030 [Nanoarchaeota archaeon]
MATDYRRLLVGLAVAVLLTLLVQTTGDAIFPPPEYQDFCGELPYPSRVLPRADNMSAAERAEIEQAQMELEEQRRTCSAELDDARQNYRLAVFLTSSILGVIAIIAGLFMPVSSLTGLAISSGLLLGGLLSLFIGTIRGWSGIGTLLRPFVILIELIIVIVVAYKKLNTEKVQKRRR